jgi:hypothetical protein
MNGGLDYTALSTEELKTLKALQNKATTANAQKVVNARLEPALTSGNRS